MAGSLSQESCFWGSPPSHVPPASHPLYSSIHGSYWEPSFPDSHLTMNHGCGVRCCY